MLTTREFLVKDRTRIINHLKMMFNTRGDNSLPKDMTTKKSVKFLLNHKDKMIQNFGKQLELLFD